MKQVSIVRMRTVCAAIAGIVLLTQVAISDSQTTGSPSGGDCSQFSSCGSCITGDSSLNLTQCVWQSCSNGNYTKCTSDSGNSGNCSVLNDTGLCQRDGDTDGGTPGAEDKDSTSPEFSQASFDLSSFIGGIILVLVLQSGAFFAMRFLKPKDSSYETIDQPQ